MKPIRIYRKFNDPSFPFQVSDFPTRRIMASFMNIHWHPEPEILYVLEGDYEIYNENGNFTLSAGEIALIPTGKVHAIRSLCPTGHYWSISFSINLIQLPESHFFQQSFVEPLKSGTLQIPNKFTPQTGLTSKATDALQQILQGTQNQQFLGLLSFFTEIQPLCKRNNQKRDLQQSHDATAACIRYMETNYSARITLEELAEHVHLHPNYLCALFKEHTGETVFEHLTRIRVESVAYLLRENDIPISKAAELSGFNTESLFYQKFKQIMGVTPSAYRKKHRNNQVADTQ